MKWYRWVRSYFSKSSWNNPSFTHPEMGFEPTFIIPEWDLGNYGRQTYRNMSSVIKEKTQTWPNKTTKQTWLKHCMKCTKTHTAFCGVPVSLSLKNCRKNGEYYPTYWGRSRMIKGLKQFSHKEWDWKKPCLLWTLNIYINRGWHGEDISEKLFTASSKTAKRESN